MLRAMGHQRFASFDSEATPWLTPPPLAESTVALITSAGLHRSDDPPFRFGDGGYRLIPNDVDRADITQSHVSVNFDRTHYQRDINVVLPLDRLSELAESGVVGAVSPWHISVMGADPNLAKLEAAAADIARQLRASGVDAAMLAPV